MGRRVACPTGHPSGARIFQFSHVHGRAPHSLETPVLTTEIDAHVGRQRLPSLKNSENDRASFAAACALHHPLPNGTLTEASMMFHRFLIGSTTCEAVVEVHLIQSLPADWDVLVRIEMGIQALRETHQAIPPYLLVHDRSWQQVVFQCERMIKRVHRFSYDSLPDFLDQHIRHNFHAHDLQALGCRELLSEKPDPPAPLRQKASIRNTRRSRPVA